MQKQRLVSREQETAKERLIKTLGDLVSFRTVADGEHTEEFHGLFAYIDKKVQAASEATGKQFLVREFVDKGHISRIITPKDPDRSDEEALLQPPIAMLIHADVVHAEDESLFTIRQDGDDIYGRGVLDMKGALAIGVDLLPELPIGAALVITSDEEKGGDSGAGFLAKQIGLRPDFLIIYDGQKPEYISFGAKGAWHAQATFGSLLNIGGHGSRHEDYPATELAMDFRNVLRHHYPWRYDRSPEGTTFNANKSEGGVATNKIAEKAKIDIDFRYETMETGEKAKQNTQNACYESVKEMMHEVYGDTLPVSLISEVKTIEGKEIYTVNVVENETSYTVVTLETKVIMPPYDINRNNPQIQRFREIMENKGEEIKTNGMDTGNHDGRYFLDENGQPIPALVFLPKGQGPHMIDERVNTTSLLHTREATVQLMHEVLR